MTPPACGLPHCTTASAPWLRLVSRLNTQPVCLPVRCENSAEDGSPKMGVSTTSRRLVPREPRPDVRAYDTPGSPS
jgi:hypothetical protein